MATTITCTYRIYLTGITQQALLGTAIAAAPIDYPYLYQNGLYVTSDVTTEPSGPPPYVQRVIALSMVPSVAATATAAVQAEGVAGGYGPLSNTVTVTGEGQDYIQQPQVKIADPTGSGATAVAYLSVAGVQIIKGGTGYPAGPLKTTLTQGLAPFVVGNGGAPSNAQQATITLGTGGGIINSVTVVAPGGPYAYAPTIKVISATGSGAVLRASMQVSQILVNTQGQSYTAPTISLTPWFKTLSPDGIASQAGLVYSWMKRIIENYCMSPVYEAVPVVT